jgi:hypothetical protein
VPRRIHRHWIDADRMVVDVPDLERSTWVDDELTAVRPVD